MHRVLQPFEFLEPGTLEEANQLLFMYGSKAKILAGGVDLVLKMRLRKIQPEYVVSLQKIPGLNYIEGNHNLRFGALTSLYDLETSPVVQKNWHLLYDAVSQIASLQTKMMGTAIGNLCVATPASDVHPALFVMDAKVKVNGLNSERIIPIENLCVAVGKLCLEPHEIVTEIIIPPLVSGTGTAFLKLAKTADDIAKINVAVAVTMASGTCKEAKIALGSVAATPIRVKPAEDLLKDKKLDAVTVNKAADIASDYIKPISDVRSTADYRKQMASVLTRDALNIAISRAKSTGGAQ